MQRRIVFQVYWNFLNANFIEMDVIQTAVINQMKASPRIYLMKVCGNGGLRFVMILRILSCSIFKRKKKVKCVEWFTGAAGPLRSF